MTIKMLNKEQAALILIVGLQAIGALFFAGQIILGLLGIAFRPLRWELYELIEIGAALGLIMGFIFGTHMLVQSLRQRGRLQKSLQVASSAFSDLVQLRFDEWALSGAERDVAIFAIKGFNTKEIAHLRETSEGTVKAQSAQIYRKAGVHSRAQLVSLFVEELMLDKPARDNSDSRRH